MSSELKKIVIVGGGSAGWLTAGILAAEYQLNSGLEIVLVESPTVKTVGVGEGTWPSMRNTLRKIGLAENQVISQCDASFKQGSKFSRWLSTKTKDDYYHPFSLPIAYEQFNIAPFWFPHQDKASFADAVSFQPALCEKNLAPKSITTPEYQFVANYGYHLDAGKFTQLLHLHCTEKLGVRYVSDDIIDVLGDVNDDIKSLVSKNNGHIEGDLFIDCTGFLALLIDKHYKIPFIDKKNILINDRAMAIHVPYCQDNQAIASHTLSTGQSSGWTWDIGLSSRRGVGHVFSSAHITNEEAEQELRAYISQSVGKLKAEQGEIKTIDIRPGYRQTFWHKNCVAIGMSAGFLEPLEASALVMIETSANMLAEQLPINKHTMPIVAKRYNERLSHHWHEIINFLKLHYVLSQRDDSDYWLDNRDPANIPADLLEKIELWKYHPPSRSDSIRKDDLFPAASYQYIYYGMMSKTEISHLSKRRDWSRDSEHLFSENAKAANHLNSTLPTNRELINRIKQFTKIN